MSDEDWGAGFAKSLGVFLNGDEIPNLDAAGRRVLDESFYLIFNAHWEPVEFVHATAKPGDIAGAGCWIPEVAGRQRRQLAASRGNQDSLSTPDSLVVMRRVA